MVFIWQALPSVHIRITLERSTLMSMHTTPIRHMGSESLRMVVRYLCLEDKSTSDSDVSI